MLRYHSPVYGVLVALVHERLAGQRVRRRRGRGVVHGREVGVRQPVLVVHRAALHVSSAVKALVVLRGDKKKIRKRNGIVKCSDQIFKTFSNTGETYV